MEIVFNDAADVVLLHGKCQSSIDLLSLRMKRFFCRMEKIEVEAA